LTTLTNIVRVEQSGGINVFNFTVAGNHNYFILTKEYGLGQTSVLVHNACGSEKACSTKLRENMKKAGVYDHTAKGQAHHIVAGNHPDAKRAQHILDKHGIGINSHWNGVFLPSVKKGNSQATIHKGNHYGDYFKAVNQKILKADAKGGKAEVLRELQRIRVDLMTGKLKLNK